MSQSMTLCLVSLLLLASCGDRQSESAAPRRQPQTDIAASTAPAVPPQDSSARIVGPSADADRLPPPRVPPVERDGVRYAQAEDGRDVGVDQPGGVLVASAANSGKLLWTLAVYANPVDPRLEADVQWVFFRSMSFDADGRLRIVNEAGQTFLVDVGRRTVSPAH
jgi:hypothetical protein